LDFSVGPADLLDIAAALLTERVVVGQPPL
jgi:hypothetical protein